MGVVLQSGITVRADLPPEEAQAQYYAKSDAASA
jgi:hypothetical protein